jgi:hypothetical protein
MSVDVITVASELAVEQTTGWYLVLEAGIVLLPRCSRMRHEVFRDGGAAHPCFHDVIDFGRKTIANVMCNEERLSRRASVMLLHLSMMKS